MHEFLKWWTPERLVILYYVFNNAVQALPDPVEGDRFYLFLFRFSHAIAANWGLVKKAPKVRYQ